MGGLRVVPIVEGHGEYEAVRILITRIGYELLGGDRIEVVRPIRWKRTQVADDRELKRTLDLAVLKLRDAPAELPSLILLLIDAEEDLPCVLGPQLLKQALGSRPDADIACVLANVEYETWFVAAAESLGEYLDLSRDAETGRRPEAERLGKGWIKQRFRGIKYSETLDQPAMTARMDLRLCRERSPSFDKLCREIGKRLSPPMD